MVVRDGVEPPTPRFSGVPNGCILANPGDLSEFRELRHPWCGHDWSRLVMVGGHRAGSSRRTGTAG